MVWRESIEPRILHITTEKIAIPLPVGYCAKSTHIRFKSREKPPIVLQICHESRAVALEHYTPSFHSTTRPPLRGLEMEQTALFFNSELDTVHILDNQLSYLTNSLT